MIDGAVLGGLCLIIGNWYTYKGKVFTGIKMFLLADFAWLWLAVQTGNIFGVISVSLGVILSFGVFYKMHVGLFHKTVNKKDKERI